MALKVIEGISLSLDKDLDLISTCIPVILKAKALRAIGVEKFPLPERVAAVDYSFTKDVIPSKDRKDRKN
jgi:hypothetical protein